MLKQLIHDKIGEIFTTYKAANNIVGMELNNENAEYIRQVERILELVVISACSRNTNADPTSFYTYRDKNGVVHMVADDGINEDKFFTNISRRIAFDDCTDEEVLSIFWRGQEVEYAGWKPMMLFDYLDADGNVFWSGSFENWDH